MGVETEIGRDAIALILKIKIAFKDLIE